MKKLITCNLLISLIVTPSVFAQSNPFGSSNIFQIIDIQTISPIHSRVSCRNNDGSTIEFRRLQKSDPRKINNKLKPLALGAYVAADFNAGTVFLINDSTIKYRLIKPTFSNQCCSITNIEPLTNSRAYFYTAKKDTANGLTYFIMGDTWGTYPGGEVGQPIYEKNYNNKRYAILNTLNNGTTLNQYVTISSEFNFITNELYNSIPRDSVPNTAPQTQKLNKSYQPWEIKPDPTIKGIGGEIALQIPKGLRYNTNLEFYQAGDKKTG